MGKMPFMQFYPADWLRDTGVLSPLAKAVWIDILAYAWNEPQRGVYERSREAFCSQLRIDQKDLISLLSELTMVAAVTASNEKVTVKSRRMFKLDMAYKSNAIRQARFKLKRKSNASVTPQTLLLTPRKEKDVDVTTRLHQETAVKRQKNFSGASQAPAFSGLALGPKTEPESQAKGQEPNLPANPSQDPSPPPQVAPAPLPLPKLQPPQDALDDLTQKQIEAQDYVTRTRAKVKQDLERERPSWEDI